MQAVGGDHVVVHDRAQAERRDLQAVSVGELLVTGEVARALHDDLSHVDDLSDVRALDECLNAKTLGGCLIEKVLSENFVGHGLVHVLESEISLPVL